MNYDLYKSVHEYKGYKICKLTRKDYLVYNPANPEKFIADCLTLKAAKQFIDAM